MHGSLLIGWWEGNTVIFQDLNHQPSGSSQSGIDCLRSTVHCHHSPKEQLRDSLPTITEEELELCFISELLSLLLLFFSFSFVSARPPFHN